MAPNHRKRRIVSAAERQQMAAQLHVAGSTADAINNSDDSPTSDQNDQKSDIFNGNNDSRMYDDIDDDEEEDYNGGTATNIIENEDDEGEDLYADNMERDYKEMPHLDAYSSSQLDDADYDPLDLQSRLQIDAELNRRDQDMARRQGRIPEMFLPDLEDPAGIKFDSKRVNRQLLAEQRQLQQQQDLEDPLLASDMILGEDDMLSPEAITEAEAAGYSLREFINLESCRRRVARDYQAFLTTYMDEHGQSVYKGKIKALCAANLESLEVSYDHLATSNAFLAKLLANCPKETLKIFDEATFKVVLEQFPEYHRIKQEVHVRICDLPTLDYLRELRNTHLNSLVRVNGVVTRRTGVFPQLKIIKFDCSKCGAILGPFTQDLNQEVKIGTCSECESKGPFQINDSQTVYRNYQKITLQESPGTIPPGRLPRSKDVILLWDLIDSVRPGEEVEVTGIFMNNYSYALNTKNGFPVFATIIEANYVGKKEDQFMTQRLTEDDIREIKALAADPMIGRRVVKSIAPSIYGHEMIKTAIALSMFGGQPKSVQGGKMQIRGDINVLMLGDPGTAKSQFLKYIEKTSPRAVFTTGQGASAVGLTASVRKDPVTREWTLEGGALVLADKGVCLIDEFDKMNDADRTSIHEAMEQQSISISKAGIVTTLQARCAVIAAANPNRGRYNASLTFAQNVSLSDPILSRFDCLCVVKDVVDPAIDALLASFVVESHMKSHPEYVKGHSGLVEGLNAPSLANSAGSLSALSPIPQPLFKKYLLFAKTNVFPTLRSLDIDKISKIYADLRQESLTSGGIPITVRHVESMVRMAEAHARLHLRPEVIGKDIDVAIRMMLESFISSQKFSVTKRLTRAFSRYISLNKDHYELLLFTMQEMMRETLNYYKYRYQNSPYPLFIDIPVDEFEAKAKDLHLSPDVLVSFYSSPLLVRSGFRYDSTKKIFQMDTPLRQTLSSD